jgi:hypothetical protein
MRINHKVLSIPPYISTSWKNIASLQSQPIEDLYSLSVHLQDGTCIVVPKLDQAIIQAIFHAHAKYLELEQKIPENLPKFQAPLEPSLPFSIKLFEMDHVNNMLQHNEQHKDAPNLPPYILTKIEEISQELGLKDSTTLPSPEPHCNCPHCQIAKAIQNCSEKNTLPLHEKEEEEVSQEDLSFTSWIISPLKKNLYRVSHPDFPEEGYQVFLDSPIGCTCGSNQCEHIKAVLSS